MKIIRMEKKELENNKVRFCAYVDKLPDCASCGKEFSEGFWCQQRKVCFCKECESNNNVIFGCFKYLPKGTKYHSHPSYSFIVEK